MNRFSPEVGAGAVRMVLGHESEQTSRWATATSIASKIGSSTHDLMERVKKANVEAGRAPGVLAEVAAKLTALARKNQELRQTNGILRKASAYFAAAEFPLTQNMTALIDDRRGTHGVAPICKVLPIARTTCYEHVARRVDPSRSPALTKRDRQLVPEMKPLFSENFEVYRVGKVWPQLSHEGFDSAMCGVERLMKGFGLKGASRGKTLRTTIRGKAAPCPLDRVNREFCAPCTDRLNVRDFTSVSTWQGFV